MKICKGQYKTKKGNKLHSHLNAFLFIPCYCLFFCVSSKMLLLKSFRGHTR